VRGRRIRAWRYAPATRPAPSPAANAANTTNASGASNASTRMKRSLDRLRRRDRPVPPAPHGAVPEPALPSGRAMPPDVA